MWRQVLQRAAVRQCHAAAMTRTTVRRTMMTTAAQKRALNKKQLEGAKEASQTTSSSPPGGSSGGKGGGTTATPPPSSGGGGGGNNTLLMGVAALAAVGAGGYMYSQQQTPVPTPAKETPGLVEKEIPAKKEEKPAEEPAPKQEPVATPEPIVEKVEPLAQDKKEEPVKTEEPVAKEEVVDVGHRVTAITVPSTAGRSSRAAPPVAHPSDGNRVAMAPLSKETQHTWASQQAAQELQSADNAEASETLQKAHQALRADLDDSLLKDVNSLNNAELKVRVVQLAAEMKERTKWEAVRLKEFLALKEKETADKYMEILQKQRLEFEGLLARRLLEQEESMTRQANAALQSKEDSIQAVVQAAADAQQAEHETDLKSTQERLTREISAKYEADFSKQLANEKASFAQEMQSKLQALQELSTQLTQLESSLEASKTFESGSQKAHRVSAAAMALGAKLETHKGAATELAALVVASQDNGVIASAVRALPKESVKTGIPTLSELQTKFDVVSAKARQAAMVPEGWSGLEGQLLGMVFSTIKLSPSPDEEPPAAVGETTAGNPPPDYVLSRAQRHVSLGELDRAVEQLDKLEGQAAFTVRDWKRAAKDRVAVENALKVIKMECALLNKSHSG